MKRLITILLGLVIPLTIVLSTFGETPSASGQQTADEYFNKGAEAYEAQDYNAAAAAFEKAVEIKPDYSEAYYNLGVTYWQQKQYKKAVEKLKKVMEIKPDSELAKKADQDIKSLKTSGISISVPTEEKSDEKEEGTAEETVVQKKVTEETTATLPELLADLEFGPTSKRLAAARGLGHFSEKEAMQALGKTIEKSDELTEIRLTAVESLGRIAKPAAIPFLQTALETQDIPSEGKQAAIKALGAINTPESLKAILSAWAGQFPGGLSDQAVVSLVQKNGKEEFADIVRPAYLQTAASEKKMYMALALGLMKDTTGIPVLVNRLKDDYPGDASPKSSLNQPPQQQPGTPMMPGMAGGMMPTGGPILKEQIATAPSWSRKDETGLRVETVEVLGGCSGANQKPFLVYLSKNDQEKKVRDAAEKAIKTLDTRIAISTDAYQKGTALVKDGKLAEALPFIQTALKENPDAPYAGEVKKLQARMNYNQALVLLKDKKKDEAIALLQSALELDPGAPFRKDAEDKLTELQAPPVAASITPGALPMMRPPVGAPMMPRRK